MGHSSRTIEDFLHLLYSYHIQALADVRSYPGSRKFPHFNREHLAQVLSGEGIEYRHLARLGGRRKRGLAESPNSGWRVEGFRNFADYMFSEEFQEGLRELETLAAAKQAAVMCAEAVPWRCHRQLIADALTSLRDIPVLHILDAKTVREHELTHFARVQEGRLIYPDPERLF